MFYGLYKDMFRRGIQDRALIDEAHKAASGPESLFSAIANYLVLRLTEADAKALVRNVATARQERTLIDRIKQMDRFRALYFCEGKHRASSVNLLSLD